MFRANSIRWWQLYNNSIRSVKQHVLSLACFCISHVFLFVKKKKKKKKKNIVASIQKPNVWNLSSYKNRQLKNVLLFKLSLEWKRSYTTNTNVWNRSSCRNRKLSLEWKSQILQMPTCEIVCLTETCGIWIKKITAWVYKPNTNVWNGSSCRNWLYMETENYHLSEKVKYNKYKRLKSFVLQKQVVYV